MTEDRWLESSFEGEMEVQYSSHPSDAVLLGHKWGCLDGEEDRQVAPHLATCQHCRARLAQLRGNTIWQGRPGFLSDPVLRSLEGKGHDDVLRGVRSRKEKTSLRKRGWRAILVPVGSLMGAAVIIRATHLVLDGLFSPSPSPFATPVQPVRWWLHLYWTLLPLAAWAAVRVAQCALTRRADDQGKSSK